MSHPTPVIEVSKLSLSMSGKALLNAVDFQIQKGERIAIIGANGAGKTTLLRCLLGILAPDHGEVKIHGNNITTLPRASVAQNIAYVPQSLSSEIHFCVQDFILMSRYSHSSIGSGPLPKNHDDLAIAQLMMQRTGIDHLAHRSLSTLSGGERQKAYIAAALTQQSSILLLDEPAAHLDPKQRESIQRLLGEISQTENLTIITVTHDLNWAAMHFDRIIGMSSGQLLYDATPSELITTENLQHLFGATWDIQAHPHSGSPMVIPTHHSHSRHD